jgi:ubiquinone/menaquinone biosynthesis C-methylase UbiE
MNDTGMTEGLLRRWMPDELAAAGRENLDAAHASEYDSKEDAKAEGERRLLQTLGMSPSSVVVDLGAGTGQFTLAAAPHCERMVAVDVSPVMIEVLREKAAAAGATNVEIVRSGFLTYQHQGQKADFVYSRFALHHLTDFWKVLALRNLRRTLHAGGVLRLWDVVYRFAPEDAEQRLQAWCETLPEKAVSGWIRADIEEHVRDEHSTFTWLLEAMMNRTGFRIERAEYSEDGIFASYVARAV